ncbi:transposable element Tc3 transposase [Trichonephila clavipes]|nr:transposable element Tc3 transposase [Trichonephila clavipes]
MLGRKIAALSQQPSSVTEVKRALKEAWNRWSPQLIHHLIASMVNQCAACLAVRGDATTTNMPLNFYYICDSIDIFEEVFISPVRGASLASKMPEWNRRNTN